MVKYHNTNVPPSLRYPLKKDIMETNPHREYFLLNSPELWSWTNKAAVLSGILIIITSIYCWHILLEHWPMFLNIRSA